MVYPFENKNQFYQHHNIKKKSITSMKLLTPTPITDSDGILNYYNWKELRCEDRPNGHVTATEQLHKHTWIPILGYPVDKARYPALIQINQISVFLERKEYNLFTEKYFHTKQGAGCHGLAIASHIQTGVEYANCARVGMYVVTTRDIAKDENLYLDKKNQNITKFNFPDRTNLDKILNQYRQSNIFKPYVFDVLETCKEDIQKLSHSKELTKKWIFDYVHKMQTYMYKALWARHRTDYLHETVRADGMALYALAVKKKLQKKKKETKKRQSVLQTIRDEFEKKLKDDNDMKCEHGHDHLPKQKPENALSISRISKLCKPLTENIHRISNKHHCEAIWAIIADYVQCDGGTKYQLKNSNYENLKQRCLHNPNLYRDEFKLFRTQLYNVSNNDLGLLDILLQCRHTEMRKDIDQGIRNINKTRITEKDVTRSVRFHYILQFFTTITKCTAEDNKSKNQMNHFMHTLKEWTSNKHEKNEIHWPSRSTFLKIANPWKYALVFDSKRGEIFDQFLNYIENLCPEQTGIHEQMNNEQFISTISVLTEGFPDNKVNTASVQPTSLPSSSKPQKTN